MNIERLQRLADKLEGVGPYKDVGPVPDHKFYMGSWYGDGAGTNKALEHAF